MYICSMRHLHIIFGMQKKIVIVDFGSQITHLLGYRIHGLNIYCEVISYNKLPPNDQTIVTNCFV